MCDTDNHEEVIGYWTCLRSYMHGRPVCLRREAKHWMVAWVLPKIVGGFDFKGKLTRDINITNETAAAFEKNVSLSFVECLVNVDKSHFDRWKVVHMWESMDQFDSNTGALTTPERTHLFSVTYELVVWDKNKLPDNMDVLRALLESDTLDQKGVDAMLASDTHPLGKFATKVHARANFTITELFPTIYPLTFNQSVVAPDTEVSCAGPPIGNTRRLLMLLVLPTLLTSILSGRVSELNGSG